MTDNPLANAPSSSERDKRLAEARRMLDAYGADPQRWPENARALYQRYKDDFRFETARREAAALDDAMADARQEAASEALRLRLLQSAPERGARRFAPFISFALRLAPAGAVAGLSAAGYVAGLASAHSDPAAAYAEAALTSTLGGGAQAWTEESQQ